MSNNIVSATSQARIGHGRVISADLRRVSQRRRTVGPLDIEDAPLRKFSPPIQDVSKDFDMASLGTLAQTGLDNSSSATGTLDFNYLLYPQNFHPLSQASVPRAFLRNVAPDTPLCSLISSLHFRSAAIYAANSLSSTLIHPHDYATIFRLWYIRLSSLSLIGFTVIAAQEIKVFTDLSSNFYRDGDDCHIVPWELRVLAIRLQAVAFNDWQRSVGSYYELAREARAETEKAVGNLKKKWHQRLQDLGIRIGNALVEMGDLSTAQHHLAGLRKSMMEENDHCAAESVRHVLALLFIRIGNLGAAEECLSADENGVLEALTFMAKAKWENAGQAWKGVIADGGGGTQVAKNNLAVCLLYSGKLIKARDAFETMLDAEIVFPGMIFNLSTVYELCRDNSRALKMQLSEKVASTTGRELANYGFKL